MSDHRLKIFIEERAKELTSALEKVTSSLEKLQKTMEESNLFKSKGMIYPRIKTKEEILRDAKEFSQKMNARVKGLGEITNHVNVGAVTGKEAEDQEFDAQLVHVCHAKTNDVALGFTAKAIEREDVKDESIDDPFFKDCKTLTEDQVKEIVEADEFQLPLGTYKGSEVRKALGRHIEAHKDEIEAEEQAWDRKLDALDHYDLISEPDPNGNLNLTLINSSFYSNVSEFCIVSKKQWNLFLENWKDWTGLIYWTDISGKEFQFTIVGWKNSLPILDDSPDQYRKNTRIEYCEISPNAGIYTFLRKFYLAENEYIAKDSIHVQPGKTFVNGKHIRIKCLPRKQIVCPHCQRRINGTLNFQYGINCPHCKEKVH